MLIGSASRSFLPGILVALGLAAATGRAQSSAAAPVQVKIDWTEVERVSKTTPTLQVVVNPPLERGSAIHDPVFKALKDLGAEYVRYVPWLPYPKLGVAELEPPHDGETSWDFSLIDPMTIDFLNATAGHEPILNFSTIPQWMFKTPKPVAYPADPNQVTWDYEQGTELRDPSGKELGDYYGRLVSWYTQGGFTDEYGHRHDSGHHYKLNDWEVLNEVDFEHHTTPELYTQEYDAIVRGIRRVEPQMKFMGLALAAPSREPHFFEYFLDHRNHQPGTPIDLISYHFYASPRPDETPEIQQYTFFEQADHFLDATRYIDAIRERLSPATRTDLDEVGCILAGDPQGAELPIPKSYWNLCGAVYAYVYGQASEMGIDIVGESQLVGYPTQFPSVSLVDWTTGQPNARFWILKLLKDNIGPGDKLVSASSGTPYVYALGVISPQGQRKLLLVNQRDRTLDLSIPGASGATEAYVDQTTAFDPPASRQLSADTVSLGGYAVAVVSLK